MSVDRPVWLTPQVLRLLDRWIALREEELSLWKSLRGELPYVESESNPEPTPAELHLGPSSEPHDRDVRASDAGVSDVRAADSPSLEVRRALDEEALLALLRSFEGAPVDPEPSGEANEDAPTQRWVEWPVEQGFEQLVPQTVPEAPVDAALPEIVAPVEEAAAAEGAAVAEDAASAEDVQPTEESSLVESALEEESVAPAASTVLAEEMELAEAVAPQEEPVQLDAVAPDEPSIEVHVSEPWALSPVIDEVVELESPASEEPAVAATPELSDAGVDAPQEPVAVEEPSAPEVIATAEADAVPAGPAPAVERAIGKFVLLVDRGAGWVAFPWEAVTRVSTNDGEDELVYEICFLVGGEERGMNVARAGRILSRLAAAEFGITREWRIPRSLEEELVEIPLEGRGEPPAARPNAGDVPSDPVEAPPASPEPTSIEAEMSDVLVTEDEAKSALPEDATPADSDSATQVESTVESDSQIPAESPIEAASPAATEPVLLGPVLPELGLDQPEPVEPMLRHVLVYELDAANPSSNGGRHSESEPETDPEAGAALVAVRYLPARVALARALRHSGWTVTEDADVNEAISRRSSPPPALLCVELPETTAEVSHRVRAIAKAGTQVFLIASRHRVVDALEMPELPRLLHPFTEGELERLPAPAAQSH